MRYVIISAVLLLSMPLFAQVGDTGGDQGCGIDYPCDSDFPDETDNAGSKVVKCTKSYGCPLCGLDYNKRTAVCFTNYGQFGHCSCTPLGTYTDKYGILRASCKVEGSCTSR